MDVEPTPEDDPMDDVTGDVGDWIKKALIRVIRKLNFQELLTLTDIPLTEPV